MRRTTRPGFVVGIAGVLCAVAAFAGPASGAVPSASLATDPQPELKPFILGPALSNGTVAFEPDGSMVVAYDIESGNGKTLVCLLSRGAGKCSTKTVLSPLSNDSTFGTPQVFVTSANHVTVLQETCCDSNPDGDDLIYTSTNGGKTFSPPVRVGNVNVDSAALIGKDLVYLGGDDGSGAQVQSLEIEPNIGVNGPAVTVQRAEALDVGITGYHGGVLVASDSRAATAYTTHVEYADAQDSPFASTIEFSAVGTFPSEQLLGISGRALLTVQSGGKQWVRLRLFSGSGFGPPHNVPGSSGGGPEWYAVLQDPSGAVHVFGARAHLRQQSDLIEFTTSNNSTWSSGADLGSTKPISQPSFAGGLDSRGTGIVLATDPAWAYPVLATQSASFNLKSSTIRRGQSTTGSGKARPAALGRRITLQVQGKSGVWFNAAATHEKSGGSFSFTIRGTSMGTRRYRVVVADVPGYLQFGYSNAKSLRVTS